MYIIKLFLISFALVSLLHCSRAVDPSIESSAVAVSSSTVSEVKTASPNEAYTMQRDLGNLKSVYVIQEDYSQGQQEARVALGNKIEEIPSLKEGLQKGRRGASGSLISQFDTALLLVDSLYLSYSEYLGTLPVLEVPSSSATRSVPASSQSDVSSSSVGVSSSLGLISSQSQVSSQTVLSSATISSVASVSSSSSISSNGTLSSVVNTSSSSVTGTVMQLEDASIENANLEGTAVIFTMNGGSACWSAVDMTGITSVEIQYSNGEVETDTLNLQVDAVTIAQYPIARCDSLGAWSGTCEKQTQTFPSQTGSVELCLVAKGTNHVAAVDWLRIFN